MSKKGREGGREGGREERGEREVMNISWPLFAGSGRYAGENVALSGEKRSLQEGVSNQSTPRLPDCPVCPVFHGQSTRHL